MPHGARRAKRTPTGTPTPTILLFPPGAPRFQIPTPKRSRRGTIAFRGSSHTYNRLVRQIGTGAMPYTEAREQAADARTDVLTSGGRDIVDLELVARWGSSGKYPSNMERDGSRMLSRHRKQDGFHLEAWPMSVPAKPLRKKTSLPPGDMMIDVLLPHEFFAAVYAAGPTVWHDVMLGPGGQEGLRAYWRHEWDKEWVQKHPMLTELERMDFTVPFTLHGDDVQVQNNSKIYILQSSSALSRAPSNLSKLLVSAILSRTMVKNKFSGITINETADELHKMVADSFRVLLEGVWPYVDYLRRPYTGWRAKKAGTPLAGPWRAAFSHVRGDLEFKARVFNWNHYARFLICKDCMAHKPPGRLSFTNLLPTAPCFEVPVSHEDWLLNTADIYLSPLAAIPGFRKERVLEDWMHDVHAGCGKHLAACALVEICGGRALSEARLAVVLETEWGAFNQWASDNKVDCTMPMFTPSLLGIHKTSSYPELTRVKAHATRVLLTYLAERVQALPRRDDDWHLLVACTSGLSQAHDIMDAADHFFSAAEAGAFYSHGFTFLATYMSLAQRAVSRNVRMYNITPKFHNVGHIVYTIQIDRVNPKFYHCYGDEDFVGRIGRVGAVVHPRTMTRRTIERYLTGLHQRYRLLTSSVAPSGSAS